MKKAKKEAKAALGKNRSARKRNARKMHDQTKRLLKQHPDAVHAGPRFVLRPMKKQGKFQVFFDGKFVGLARNRDGEVDVEPSNSVPADLAQILREDKPRIQRAAVVMTALSAMNA